MTIVPPPIRSRSRTDRPIPKFAAASAAGQTSPRSFVGAREHLLRRGARHHYPRLSLRGEHDHMTVRVSNFVETRRTSSRWMRRIAGASPHFVEIDRFRRQSTSDEQRQRRRSGPRPSLEHVGNPEGRSPAHSAGRAGFGRTGRRRGSQG
jgi:hypothetical protein